MANRVLWKNGDAVTQVVGFLVGGFLFVATLGVVIVVTKEHEVDLTRMTQAELDAMAITLGEIILTSPGEGWHSGEACDSLLGIESTITFTPDTVSRFGLGSEGCEKEVNLEEKQKLSFDKITNLQRASISADAANGYLDYDETRESLGLDAVGRDFHIRSSPVLSTVRSTLENGYLDPNLRPLYIGDYEKQDSGQEDEYDVPHDAGMTDNGSKADLWVNITNDGVSSTLFEVSFILHLGEEDVELIRHTPAVAPGGYTNVTVWVPKTTDWEWASSDIEYTINDPAQTVGTGIIDGSAVDMIDGSTNRLTDIHSGDLQFEWLGSPLTPKIYYYNAYDGDGATVAYSDWKLEILDSAGGVVGTDSSLHSRGWEAFTLNGPDTYTVNLKTVAGALLQVEYMVVTEDLLGPYAPSGSSSEYYPSSSVLTEIGFIDPLIEHFEANVFSADYDNASVPYLAGGDVFPDQKTVMNNELEAVLIDDKGTPTPTDDEATLANYNVLIVGSNVNHQMMTSESAKDSIKQWVYAGGTLVVFGSADQSVQWLQPIFHSSIQSASGGLYTPDEDHPVLHVPNDLDYAAYSSNGSAWAYTRSGDEEHFTHVLKLGGDDIMALSDAGEFGEGRVLLSAFQPHDLFNGTEADGCDPANLEPTCPGLMLLHNLVTQAYAGLFLDYGPPIPLDRPTGSSTRVAAVFHPELDRTVVLQMQIFVF